MTYVIPLPPVGTQDRACMQEGPVDCSYKAPQRDSAGSRYAAGNPGDSAELEPVAAKPHWWPGLPLRAGAQ
jgi:hypothetical protein